MPSGYQLPREHCYITYFERFPATWLLCKSSGKMESKHVIRMLTSPFPTKVVASETLIVTAPLPSVRIIYICDVHDVKSPWIQPGI